MRARPAAVLGLGLLLAGCDTSSVIVVDPPPDELVRDLVGLGGHWAMARGINNAGRIVGEASVDPSHSRAFSWSALGGIRNLGTLGGASSGANAINFQSQIVGWAATPNGLPHAFLMTVGDASMRDLGVPLGGEASWANDINDNGMVVGHWTTPEGELNAFAWTMTDGMRVLAAVPGITNARAFSVNHQGDVVGAGVSSLAFRAVRWSANGDVADLGTLPGASESLAWAINIEGKVVGETRLDGKLHRAFLWTSGSGMQDLGVLPGMDWSAARDISDQGHVVGYSGLTGAAVGRAFIWTAIDGMRDLGALVGADKAEAAAFGVNYYGRAVGYSWNGTKFRPVSFPQP